MSETGHVKHNPETGEVALRTIFPTDKGPQLAAMAWLVATKNIGARNASDADVADWETLYEPPVEPVVRFPLSRPSSLPLRLKKWK